MFKVIKKLGLGRFVILLTIIILYSLAAFIPVKFMQSMIDAVYLDSYPKAIKQILISGDFYMHFIIFVEINIRMSMREISEIMYLNIF